jgi:predicted Zn-dependent protease
MALATAAVLSMTLTAGCAAIHGRDESLQGKSTGLAASLTQANHDYSAGRLKKARKEYKDMLKSVPDNVLVLHRLGNISYQLGNYANARNYYKRALAKQPKEPAVYFNSAMVDLTTARIKLNHYLQQSGEDPASVQHLMKAIDRFASESAEITSAKEPKPSLKINPTTETTTSSAKR